MNARRIATVRWSEPTDAPIPFLTPGPSASSMDNSPRVDIHSALTPSSALQLDLSVPSAVLRNNPQLGLVLSEPACFPPLKTLDIRITAGLFRATVEVAKGSSGDVTVGDVLTTIHGVLRQRAACPEDSQPYVHRRIATVKDSLGQDAIEAEIRFGSRKVDLLLGRTLFAGLTLRSNNSWQLELETPLRYKDIIPLSATKQESKLKLETSPQYGDIHYIPSQDVGAATMPEDVFIPNDTSRDSDDPISTFVVYSPVLGAAPSLPKWNLEDFLGCQTLDPDGDITVSNHTPEDALLWVETHYEDHLLQTIRDYGLGGPIAAMLSPDESVLVLFGSILDDTVHQFAKQLSELSKFHVMIRPLEDDPVQKWSSNLDEATAQIVTGGDEDTDNLDGSQDITENDSDTDSGSDISSVDTGVTGVFPLRGGAGPNSGFEPWYSPDHEFNIYLKTLSDVKCQVSILCNTKFTVQSKYTDISREFSRPQTICKVKFSVGPTSRDVWPDRSYSKIVFIVTHPISSCIPLPCEAHIPPKQTVKTVNTVMKSVTAALGFNPASQSTGMLGLSGTYGTTQATESQSDRPTPHWIVGYKNGPWGKFQGRYFWEHDVAYTATDHRQHQMQVEFSVGMDPAPINDEDDPTTSFIIQHQTMLWMRHETLRSRGYGMMIMSLSHISNITTEMGISLRKESTIKLAGTPLQSPTVTDKTQSSLMEVSTKHALAFEKPGLLQRLGFKSATNPEVQMENSPSFLIRQLPLDDINAQGYNLMTKKWIMPTFAPWQDILKAVIDSADDTQALQITDKAKGKQRARTN